MKILGIKIDNLSRKDILKNIEKFLVENKFHQIATINPEFILQAQKDNEFKNILNSCDLNIADGVGLRFAGWRFGKNLKCRFSGIDLTWEILKIANEKKLKICLVANKNGLSSWQETASVIKKKYSELEIKGVSVEIIDKHNKELGFKIYDAGENAFTVRNFKSYIIHHKSDIVFCALGAPYQELLLNNLRDTGVRLAMGVGGSFDFIAGKIKRAPKWMRFFGLEWLFRLSQQPNRIKRIFNAVIIFPIRIVLNK